MSAAAGSLSALLWLALTAGEANVASFGLVVGVNRPGDPTLVTLRYADDDAARYFELFEAVGIRTELLAQLDENTQRLHPKLVDRAHPPTQSEFGLAVARLSEQIAKARQQGQLTRVYLVFAGHGTIEDNEGALLLEDGRATSGTLETALNQLDASEEHLIIDACNSFFLAWGRGPGGKSEPVTGFSVAPRLAARPHLGLLLSTSSARESHEWAGVQAGVFHHEVQSGLLGAADIDLDGRISYREISAFVERANAAIPNERYRPDVYSRAPRRKREDDKGVLFHLSASPHRVEVDSLHSGRFFLENADGIRWADFHSAPGQVVRLIRPRNERLYLTDVNRRVEYRVDDEPGTAVVGRLRSREPRVAERGAAHEAFTRLFELPFDIGVVKSFSFRAPEVELVASPGSERPLTPRRGVALGVGAAGLGAAAAGLFLHLEGQQAAKLPPDASQEDAARANRSIGTLQAGSAACFIAAGVGAAAGLALWFWPEASVEIGAGGGGGVGGVGGVRMSLSAMPSGVVLIGDF